MNQIARFLDRLEDRVRAYLSHYPIFYSLIGGVCIVIFWRGVWHFADYLMLPNLLSAAVAASILAVSGLFVSFFIGDSIILSGLKKEKKAIEKTEEEVFKEAGVLEEIHSGVALEEVTLGDIKAELREIKVEIKNLRKS